MSQSSIGVQGWRFADIECSGQREDGWWAEARHGWLLRGSADAYSAAPYVDFFDVGRSCTEDPLPQRRHREALKYDMFLLPQGHHQSVKSEAKPRTFEVETLGIFCPRAPPKERRSSGGVFIFIFGFFAESSPTLATATILLPPCFRFYYWMGFQLHGPWPRWFSYVVVRQAPLFPLIKKKKKKTTSKPKVPRGLIIWDSGLFQVSLQWALNMWKSGLPNLSLSKTFDTLSYYSVHSRSHDGSKTLLHPRCPAASKSTQSSGPSPPPLCFPECVNASTQL